MITALTLQWIFTHKLLILVIKTQIMYQKKDIVHAYLLLDLIFENTSEKVEKIIFENSIFWGVCGNPHTPGT